MKNILIIVILLNFNIILSQTIVINEFSSSNTNTYDWIEIYNFGNEAINLQNFHLSDDADSLQKWTFPDVKIWQKNFIIIYASGKNTIDSAGNIHTNFKIKSTGEPIFLLSSNNKIIDSIEAVQLNQNTSLGRYPNGLGSFKFYNNQSLGKRNNYQYTSEYIPNPFFSHESGFFSEKFHLKITHSNPEVTIHYTLDGSEPTKQSPIFPDSMLIFNNFNNKNIFSAISTTPGITDWYGWHQPVGLVEKCTNIRAKAFKNNSSSATITKTYFVDKNINTKYTIPVISLSIKTEDLIGNNGIFINYDSTGKDWEIPAHIDFFESDGTLGFSANIGIRTHGANSRKYSQKSLRIFFRKQYGTTELEYQVFPENDVKIFKKLILRNAGSDWAKLFFRDAFAQSILIGFSNLPHQAYRPAIVFINGEFAGLMNIREYYDKNYFAQHFGYEKINLIKEPEKRIKHGDNQDFIEILNFAKNSDLSIDSNYKYITNLIDISSYIDYQILQIFSMNTDQPGKNVFYWQPQNKSRKWQWVLYDMDDSFRFNNFNNFSRNGLIFCTSLDSISSTNLKPKSSKPSWANNTPENTLLFRKLLQNETFRTKFINRFADLLNSAFSPEYLQKKLNKYYDAIKNYIPQQYNRWHKPTPTSFNQNYNYVLDFINNRKTHQTNHLLAFFELNKTVQLNLEVNDTLMGYIRINSLNINKSLPCINKSPQSWAGTYFSGIPITIEAIPYNEFHFSNWDNDMNSATKKTIILLSDTKFKAIFIKNQNLR